MAPAAAESTGRPGRWKRELRSLVHGFLEAFACLELRLLGCGDLNPLTRAGIAPSGSSPLADRECTKADATKLVTRLPGIGYRVEPSTHRLRRVGLPQPALVSATSHQTLLIHIKPPPQ